MESGEDFLGNQLVILWVHGEIKNELRITLICGVHHFHEDALWYVGVFEQTMQHCLAGAGTHYLHDLNGQVWVVCYHGKVILPIYTWFRMGNVKKCIHGEIRVPEEHIGVIIIPVVMVNQPLT